MTNPEIKEKLVNQSVIKKVDWKVHSAKSLAKHRDTQIVGT